MDIWTIGCILAEIAINEPLFNGDTEIEQLFRIFSMLGSPNNETIGNINESYTELPKWEQIKLTHILCPRKSPEFLQLIEIMIPNREAAFKKLSKIGNVIGQDGMDLLEKTLCLDPQKRPSTDEILNHPFFKEFHRPDHIKSRVSISKISEIDNKILYEIWEMHRKNENLLKAKSGYMQKQSTVNETMRSILIDWLVDVSVHFELQNETLHLAVSYLDRVLSETNLDKSKLQLLGVTCMKIADVFNEKSKEYYRQENAKEYAYITAEEYTETELLMMEKNILSQMKFRLLSPTTIHFLKIYYQILNIDPITQILCNFLADIILLNYESINYMPSLLSSAILCYACSIQNSTPVVFFKY